MVLPLHSILFNKYRIDAFIGQGAFARVYSATHLKLNAPRALKILKRDTPGLDTSEFYDYELRFELEAQLGARLGAHPHIIQVHDFEQQGETLALVMALASGGSLSQKVKQYQAQNQAFPLPDAARIARQTAEGLAALHALDAVHRDLKPSNILFDEHDSARVSDLGVVQIPGGPSLRSRVSQALLHPGTPGYMSPEQESTVAYLTPASDIYSLGLVLFWMLSGRMYRNLRPGTRLKELRPDTPAWLDDLTLRMLADDPRQRPWDGSEAARLLAEGERRWRAGKPPPQPGPEKTPKPLAPVPAPGENEQPAVKPAERPVLKPPAAAVSGAPPGQGPAADLVRRRLWRWLPWALTAVAAAVILALALTRGQPPASIPPGSPASTTSISLVAEGTRTPESKLFATRTVSAQETASAATAQARQRGTDSALEATATWRAAITDTPTPDPRIPPPCTQIGQTWTSPVDGMSLVCVPAGDFSMGSEDGSDDEKPVHEVSLDAFWIDRSEVTNATFAAFVQATGYQTTAEKEGWAYAWTGSGWDQVTGADWQHPQGPESSIVNLTNHPVVQVSWNDAKAYCAWAERRLPTEAEWEKAARGTDGRTYPWGEGINCNLANYGGVENGCVGDTTAVGSYPDGASPYGALDMAGNVWEWAADWYAEGYYLNSPDNNPQGPASGEYRVLRGGSWLDSGGILRSSFRVGDNPVNRYDDDGFRCARSP